jgi:hypothetical protein
MISLAGKRFSRSCCLICLQVFPFAILIDPQMRIYHMGHSVKNVFPQDTVLMGRHLEDVFRLVRPDILLEWNRVCLVFT